MKKVTIVLAIVAALSVTMVSVSQANFLGGKAARNAAFNVAKDRCNHLNTCRRYGAGNCRRRNQYKVVCGAYLEGQNARGAYRCTFPVTVSVARGSNQRYVNPGKVRCHAI